MARTSRFRSAFCSLAVTGLLAACAPRVVDDDDFIEEQCTMNCDRLDECGRPSDDCVEVCSDLHTWEPESCEEVTADYLLCLRELTCEELTARRESVENGEGSSDLPCYDESFAAAICAN